MSAHSEAVSDPTVQPTGGSSAPRADVGSALPVVVAALVAAGGTLVAALVLGHGVESRPPGDLPYPGAGTEWALPVARVLHDLAAVVTVGFLLLAVALLPDKGGLLRRPALAALVRARVAAAVWLIATLVEAVLGLSQSAAEPVPRILSVHLVGQYLTQVTEGQAALGVLLAAAAVLAGPPVQSANAAAIVLGIAGLGVLLPPLLTGHSSSASNHDVATTSLGLHVAAAVLWIGGLVAVGWLARRRSTQLRVALPRFSRLALVCFVVLALSGVVNAAIRLGRVDALWQDRYGLLVLGKVALLAALGVFGYRHRRGTVATATAGDSRAFLRLAGVEVVVMAAAVGLAVALSRSPTPVARAEPDVSPAKAALGYDLPGPVSVGRLLFSWQPQVLFLLVVGVGLVAYAHGVRRLHQAGTGWSRWRSAAWSGGLAVVVLATQSGFSRYGAVLFSVHVAQQALLGLVASPLLVLGAPVTLALRVLPSGQGGYRSVHGWLSVLVGSPLFRLLSRPTVAIGVLLVVALALYDPAVFEALMRQHAGHLLMEVLALGLGCLVFRAMLAGDTSSRALPRRLLAPALAVGLVVFGGVALMRRGEALASGWFGSLGRTWGASLLADQRTGGVVLLAVGIPVLVLVALAVGLHDGRPTAGRGQPSDDVAAAGSGLAKVSP